MARTTQAHFRFASTQVTSWPGSSFEEKWCFTESIPSYFRKPTIRLVPKMRLFVHRGPVGTVFGALQSLQHKQHPCIPLFIAYECRRWKICMVNSHAKTKNDSRFSNRLSGYRLIRRPFLAGIGLFTCTRIFTTLHTVCLTV